VNRYVARRSTDVAGAAAPAMDAKDQQSSIVPYLARAAAAAAAAVTVALLGGVAQAGDPPNQLGAPKNQPGPLGEPGTLIATCRWVPPVENLVLQCTFRTGVPGSGGPAVGY
jgi:hypothetical protein